MQRKDSNSFAISQKNAMWFDKNVLSLCPEITIPDMAKIYNPDAVYISYARNPRPEERHPEWNGIADIVEPLAQAVRNAGLICYTDTADIGNGDSINEFEDAIGRAKCVILVFSARYFTRPHCMYEFKQILNGYYNGTIQKLVLIRSGVCNFDDLNFVADLHGEWGRLAFKYEMQPKKAIMEYAKKCNYYKDDIKKLPDFFSRNNYDRAESLDMDKLMRQIKPIFVNTRSYNESINKSSIHKVVSDNQPTPQPAKYNPVSIAAIAISLVTLIVMLTQFFSKGDDKTIIQNGSSQSDDLSVSTSIGGHEYVDLGLPSGTLWAASNIGAANPWDYGDYFAWGETTPYYSSGGNTNNPVWKSGKSDGYDWSSYKYANGDYTKLTKYCTKSDFGNNGYTDSRTTLERSDDAAYQNWGSDWCMPTLDQIKELEDKCTWTWTTKNGNEGYEVKGPNGNSLFLPAAGCRYGTDLDFVGSYGRYWSSSLNGSHPSHAWYLESGSLSVVWFSYFRYCGLTVRPVRCR